MRTKKQKNILWMVIVLSIISGSIGFKIGYSFQPYSQVTLIGQNNLKVLFTYPKSFRDFGFVECEKYIIGIIDSAKKNIYIQAFGWTSRNIANALVKASKRGVIIKVLLDKDNEAKPSDAMKLLMDNDIEVKIRKISGIAHNKIMIIDEETVITGSYNFTNSANERNDENILIINNVEIAQQYLANWKKCCNFSHQIGSRKEDSQKPWQSRYGNYANQPIQTIPLQTIDYIKQAQKRVYVLVGGGLDEKIAKALVEANKRGVDVKIIVNHADVKKLSNIVEYLCLNKVMLKKALLTKIKSTYILVDEDIAIVLNKANLSSCKVKANIAATKGQFSHYLAISKTPVVNILTAAKAPAESVSTAAKGSAASVSTAPETPVVNIKALPSK